MHGLCECGMRGGMHVVPMARRSVHELAASLAACHWMAAGVTRHAACGMRHACDVRATYARHACGMSAACVRACTACVRACGEKYSSSGRCRDSSHCQRGTWHNISQHGTGTGAGAGGMGQLGRIGGGRMGDGQRTRRLLPSIHCPRDCPREAWLSPKCMCRHGSAPACGTHPRSHACNGTVRWQFDACWAVAAAHTH